MTDIPPKR